MGQESDSDIELQKELWKQMLARSFAPWQWFLDDDSPSSELAKDADQGSIMEVEEAVTRERQGEHVGPMQKGRRMYVYRHDRRVVRGEEVEGYAVGFYRPTDKVWEEDSFYPKTTADDNMARLQAAEKAHWLNGGN